MTLDRRGGLFVATSRCALTGHPRSIDVDARILVIVGPSSAGKTTSARAYLPRQADSPRFLNADPHRCGIGRRSIPAAAERAARVMLEEMTAAPARGKSFAFERRWRGSATCDESPSGANGFRVALIFLALPMAKAAIARVAQCVRLGGHDIPEAVVRRRLAAGHRNLDLHYRDVADQCLLYDNADDEPVVLATGGRL